MRFEESKAKEKTSNRGGCDQKMSCKVGRAPDIITFAQYLENLGIFYLQYTQSSLKSDKPSGVLAIFFRQ